MFKMVSKSVFPQQSGHVLKYDFLVKYNNFIFILDNISTSSSQDLQFLEERDIENTSMINVITQSDNPSTSTDILFHNARNNCIERRNETNSVHNENNELALENTSDSYSLNSMKSCDSTRFKGCGRKGFKCSIL